MEADTAEAAVISALGQLALGHVDLFLVPNVAGCETSALPGGG